jgi:hypothetical protein
MMVLSFFLIVDTQVSINTNISSILISKFSVPHETAALGIILCAKELNNCGTEKMNPD